MGNKEQREVEVSTGCDLTLLNSSALSRCQVINLGFCSHFLYCDFEILFLFRQQGGKSMLTLTKRGCKYKNADGLLKLYRAIMTQYMEQCLGLLLFSKDKLICNAESSTGLNLGMEQGRSIKVE